jgi:tripartite-type tricarboxylate transporter receptor subunit TctC
VPILLKNILGMKLKIILGYKAPGEIALAMQRGEVGALVQAVGAPHGPRRRDWLDSGRMRVLFTMEPEPVAWLNAPTILDLTRTDEQRRIFGFLAVNMQLWRPVLAPPGVPQDRIAALRGAFDATMRDQAFLAEAGTMGLEVAAWNAATVLARVHKKMQMPNDIAARIADAIAKN